MARSKGAQVNVVLNPNLALDLDTPADLDLFNSVKADA
jgi:2-phospho-L-lactate guanylyltransferase (CobY/MobA/RfbA family)